MKYYFYFFLILITLGSWIHGTDAQDITRPTVTINIPSGSQDGAFDVTVVFSEAVTGFVQSELVVSGTSGATITDWDAKSGGTNYVATITPTLTGTAIFNVAANVAQDTATNFNTAATQKTVQVDKTRPTVSISVPSGSQDGAFNVTVVFSEVVTGFVQSELTLGTSVPHRSVSITNWIETIPGTTYTATITPGARASSTHTDYSVTFNVAENVAADSATNGNTVATQKTVQMDYPPGLLINISKQVVGGITLQSGVRNGPFDVHMVFYQQVTGFVQSDLSVSGAGASITNWDETLTGYNYTATITPTTEGIVTLEVEAGVAEDSTNNNNIASDEVTVTIDMTPPVGEINHNDDPTPVCPTDVKFKGEFTVRISFNEGVEGFEQDDVVLSGTANATITKWVSSNNNKLVTVNPTREGTVIFNIAQGSLYDSAGNGNSAVTDTFNVDQTSPVITLVPPTGEQLEKFQINYTFNEDMASMLDKDNLTVEYEEAAGADSDTWSYSSRVTSTFIEINPDIVASGYDGDIVVKLPENTVTDCAGNGNTAAEVRIPFYSVKPKAIITLPSSEQDGEFDITITFDMVVTGFAQEALRVVIVDGVQKNVPEWVTDWVPNSDGRNYVATITPMKSGTVYFYVRANMGQNSRGNYNPASNTYNLNVNLPSPTASITVPTGTQAGEFDVTVVFSQSVTNFIQSELVVTGTSGATITDWDAQDGGTDYVATITPMQSGTAIFNVAANVAENSESNFNTAATEKTVQVDKTRPTVSISVPSIPQNADFDVTVVFSESVTGFVQSELVVSGTSGASITNWDAQTGGTTYVATITTTQNLASTAIFNVAANVAKDVAENLNTAATQKTIKIDKTPPNVTINVPTGVQGGVFDVTVEFSEAVTGFLQSELVVSGTSGASITNWVAQTVGRNYMATITPTQTGTAIFNVTANVAQDTATNSNTAATQKTVQVDKTSPTVSITVPSGTQGGVFDVTVVFSEAVTGFLQSELVVSGTSGATITDWDAKTGGTNYVATITPTQSGQAIFNVAANVAEDSVSNNNTAATQKTVQVDKTSPTVSITVPSGVQDGVFDVTVVFSEAVTGFVQSELVLSGTSGATITDWDAKTGGTNYVATITPTLTGTAIFNVAANVAKDTVNNNNTVATQKTVQIDKTLPTVSINVPSATQGGVFDVTVVFSEAVTGFVQSELVVSGTSGATITDWDAKTGGTNYVATITPTQSGTAILNVAANVAKDAADNQNSAATQKTVQVDKTSPTVSITIPSGTQGGVFDVTVVFSEAVTGFVQSELVLSGTSGASITDWDAVSGGTNYVATITPTQSGTAIFNVAANVAKDAADNQNTAATQKTVQVDKTSPTVSITIPSGTQGGVFDVTVVFSEAVTGFVQSELVLSGTSGATITDWDAKTGGTNYVATITPTLTGTAIFNVAANVAQDTATNSNTAATEKTVQVDKTSPTVSISVPSGTQGGVFDVTVVFSEAVTGFVQSELVLSGTSGATITDWDAKTGGTNYVATITPTLTGTAIFNVAANVAQDTATNSNTAATEKTVQVDKTSPTVSISVPSGTQGGVFDVTVVFSEAVTGFVQSELVLSGTSGSSITDWDAKTGGTNYVATITPTLTGTAIFNVAANVAQDTATNSNTAATEKTVQVDKTSPTVSISVPSGTQGGVFDVTVVFSEAVTGFVQSELVLSGTSGSSITNWDAKSGGTNYVATITPTLTGTAIFNVAANVAKDTVNNNNTVATQKTVQIDKTLPTVSINVPSATQGGVFDVTVVFSEAVTGFLQSELVVTGTSGSTITNWDAKSGGTNYVATITPTLTGTAIFNVAANVAKDTVNNNNTVATQKTVQIDKTLPTVSINVPSATQGGVFDVTVVFSEAVTGFLQSELVVTGTSGSTITNWDAKSGGTNYVATITPTLTGTAIFNVAANVAKDTVNNNNTVATQKTVQIDKTLPTVSINVPSATQGGVFDVTVVFSEAVTGFLQSELVVTGTSGSTITNWDAKSGGTNYVATITPTLTGTAIFNVAANVAKDTVNNNNTVATQKTVQIDKTLPTVSINVPSATQGGVFDVTVVFSEAVTGFLQSELVVSGTSGATITDWDAKSGGTNYVATITPTQSGTAIFNVAANVAKDAADNQNTAATEKTVQVDKTSPTVSITIPSGTQGGVFDVTVVFSEAVTGFVQSELVLSGTSGASITDWDAVSGGTNYVATITPTQSGTAIFNVAANVAKDTADNQNTAATQKTVQVDKTRPTVSITVPSGTQRGVFDVTVEFSEAVTGFVQSELVVSGASGASITNWDAQTGGTNYVATITPTQSGTAIFNVAANVAKDSADNQNSAATEKTVQVDKTSPTVSITVPSGTQGGVFDVTVVFSEAVTGFLQSELVVSGTSGASITNWVAQTGGANYVATITPTQSGDAIFNVAANVAQDTATNYNTAATQKTVQVDKTRPTVSITVPSGTQGGVFDVTVEFSEAVTGFVQSELVLSGTSGASITDWDAVSGGTNYVATITPTQSGTAIFNVAANVAKDAADNQNTAATQKTVQVDKDLPSVIISVPSIPQNGVFDVTVVFSESVTGFLQSELVVSGTSGATITDWDAQTGGTNYVATITPTQSGNAIFNVAANVAQDAVDNLNTAATQQTVEIDTIRPNVTITAPSDGQSTPFDVTVTFTEPVTGFVQSELVLGGTSEATITNWDAQTDGANYIATITPSQSGMTNFNVSENVAEDAAGNLNTAATEISTMIDLDPPRVSLTVPSKPQRDSFDVQITFTEPVYGFVQDELQMEGTSELHTIKWVAENGRSDYTVTIDPIKSGMAIFSVPENVAQDTGGNLNRNSLEYRVEIDMIRPTVSIQLPSDGQNEEFEVTIMFSEPVDGFFENEFLISNPDDVIITDWKALQNRMQYVATIRPITEIDLPLIFRIDSNVAHDEAGNGNEPTQSEAFSIDSKAPCLTIQVDQTVQTGPFDVNIVFSEPVTGFRQNELRLGGMLEARITNWHAENNRTNYRATITPRPVMRTNNAVTMNSGTVTLHVTNGVAVDDADNENESVGIKTVAVVFTDGEDTTRPWGTIQTPTDTQVGAFDVTIIFTEPVTGFNQEHLNVIPSDTNIKNWTPHPDGRRYIATIEPFFSGSVILNVPDYVAIDENGNGNHEIENKHVNVVFPITDDREKPTATISVPIQKPTGTFDVNITFSEPVTGFRQNDLHISDPCFPITIWQSDPNRQHYTATITPTQDGTVTFSIPARVAQDSADNWNTAAVDMKVTTELPTTRVYIEAPITVREAFEVTIVFTEPVTGFTQEDLLFDDNSTAIVSITTWDAQPGRTHYTATITPTKNGALILSVPTAVVETGNMNSEEIKVLISPEDVNQDGLIDDQDLNMVMNNLGTYIPSERENNPDVNRDGFVTPDDFAAVQAQTDGNSAAAPASSLTPQSLIDNLKQPASMDSGLIPNTTALLPNYPNPFNPETWIPYQLATDSDVQITIYDMHGTRIRFIKIGYQSAGYYTGKNHAVYWDGTNDAGEHVANGIYFYQLLAGNIPQTRKMLILK